MIKHTQTPSLWLLEADESYFEERFEGKKLKTTKRTSPLQETLKKNIVCLYDNQLNLEYCVHEPTTLLDNRKVRLTFSAVCSYFVLQISTLFNSFFLSLIYCFTRLATRNSWSNSYFFVLSFYSLTRE